MQELERAKAADKAAKSKYLTGGRGGGKPVAPSFEGNADSGANLAAFFERQDNVEKRRIQGREEAQELHNYTTYNPDKKVCPRCGGVQSFAEVKGKVKRCPRDTCGGALYRPKMLWSEVQGSFLGRWTSFIKDSKANLKKLEAEVRPPFRVTHRKVFNRETGEMEDEEIPKLKWDEVGDEFLKRQEEVVERLNARLAAAAAAKSAPIVFVKEKGRVSKFKPSKPFPDFDARQAAMLERRNLSFEERLAVLQGM